MASIIERPNKAGSTTWQVLIRIPDQPRIIKSFPTEAEAKEFAEITEAALRKAKSTETLATYRNKTYTEYEQELLADVVSSFIKSNVSIPRHKQVSPIIIKTVGDVKIGGIKKVWVRDYIAKMRKMNTRRKTKYSWESIQKLIQVIKMAIRWRAEECDLPVKPFPFSVKDMFPKRWEVKRDRRLEKSEYIKLMTHVRAIKAPSSRFWRYLIRLAIETAARQQELIYAEWREVDMDRKIWFIPASHTKCQTARVVPLSRTAFRILSMLKLMASPDDTRIFHGLSNPSVVCAMFRKFTRKLNLKDLRFHDLRHEAISRMVIYKRQLSVFEIMTMVGHSSMEMLRRYTNLRTDELVGRMD